jgi:hypothetical protein
MGGVATSVQYGSRYLAHRLAPRQHICINRLLVACGGEKKKKNALNTVRSVSSGVIEDMENIGGVKVGMV